jgi:hypothetical protein
MTDLLWTEPASAFENLNAVKDDLRYYNQLKLHRHQCHPLLVHDAIVASSPGVSSSLATSTGSATTTQATSSLILPSPSVHAAIIASSAGSV